jgi:hypothetical protein
MGILRLRAVAGRSCLCSHMLIIQKELMRNLFLVAALNGNDLLLSILSGAMSTPKVASLYGLDLRSMALSDEI